jgi:hypothetical protein
LAGAGIGLAMTAAVLAGGQPAASQGPYLAPAGCVVGPDDLIGWWSGEDDLTARVGPDLIGTVGFTDGAIGRSMAFAGSGSSADVSVTTLPTVSAEVTVDAWIRPAAPDGSVQTILSRWDFPSTDDQARSYALMLDTNGDLLWLTDETSTLLPSEHRVPTAPTTDLFDGQFHHVAATWDGRQSVVYIDGVAVDSAPAQGGALNRAATTTFRIGRKSGLGAPFAFNGAIDEAAVARRALTPTEIASLFAAGPSGKCAIAVTAGTPSYARGAATRIKGFNSGAEIFVGPMTSASATPRAEANFNEFQTVGQKTYQLTFAFDPLSNTLTSDLASPNVTVTYDLDTDAGGGCSSSGWDVAHLLILDNRTDSAVNVANLSVDGIALGSYGINDKAGTPGVQNWGIHRSSFGRGFTITADLVVDGYLGNEAIKVELSLGCRTA